MSDLKVSVIIPVLNGGAQLSELLSLLKLQTIKLDDIHVVDSSSSDDSVNIARGFGAHVNVIPREQFDHGGTRSEMAQQVPGDILLFFTQDALPASTKCVERLLEPFKDPDVAICYGRQLPMFDAEYSARELRRFNYPEKSETVGYEDRQFRGLQTIFCSNSFAAYRRVHLEKVGFFRSGLIFGEDMEVSARLLGEGLKKAYVAEAKVYHSHNYSLEEEFRRSFDIGVMHTTEHWLLETFGNPQGLGKAFVLSQLRRLLAAGEVVKAIDCFLRSGSKYCGYMLGRKYSLLPLKMVISCSLHRSWWVKNSRVTDSPS